MTAGAQFDPAPGWPGFISMLAERHFSPFKAYVNRARRTVVMLNPKVGTKSIRQALTDGVRDDRRVRRSIARALPAVQEGPRVSLCPAGRLCARAALSRRVRVLLLRAQSLRALALSLAEQVRLRTSCRLFAQHPAPRTAAPAPLCTQPRAARRHGRCRDTVHHVPRLCREPARRPARSSLGRPARRAADAPPPLRALLPHGGRIRRWHAPRVRSPRPRRCREWRQSLATQKNVSPRAEAPLYDAALAARVHVLYQRDFELFGYAKDSWRGL